MNLKRIAILSGLTLFPLAAFAATASTGGLCASVCGLFGGCCGG